MNGYLIDGSWIAASEIAAVNFMILNRQNNTWVAAKSLEVFRGAGEQYQAIQYILKNGRDILIERPSSISSKALTQIMN